MPNPDSPPLQPRQPKFHQVTNHLLAKRWLWPILLLNLSHSLFHECRQLFTRGLRWQRGSDLCGAFGHEFCRICALLFAHGCQNPHLSFAKQRPFAGIPDGHQCFCGFSLLGLCLLDSVSKELPWSRHLDDSLADNNTETKRTKRTV